MAQVQTVQGPVDAGQLGTVLIHEHVRFRDEAVAANWPSRYDADAELAAALEAVNAARDRGVRTIVDPTAMFGGRDVHFMAHVAEQTGVQIVPCTGIYSYDYLPHYFENRSEDQIADMFVEDIETGIQGSELKAAFLKCAADAQGVTEHVEKVHRAVARASLQTGAPIMAHSRPASNTGPRQIEIFREEGVDPAKIQIAHTGGSDDLDYVEIDWFPPEAVEGLIAQGLVRDWSMTLAFDQVLPWLREQGVWDDAAYATVFEENPRRWLAGP